jgi:ADP-heptose:LPS heptosyltransferase
MFKKIKNILPNKIHNLRAVAYQNPKIYWIYFLYRLFNKKVIIIKRKGNFGDIINTFPLVKHIRRENPTANIIYECLPWNSKIPRLCKDIDLIIGTGTTLAEFVYDAFERKQIFEPLCCEEKKPVEPFLGLHVVDEMAFSVGISLEDKNVKVSFSNKSKRSVNKKLHDNNIKNHFCVIHVGPTWNVKEWPVEKWEFLVRKITNDLKCDVIQVGAEFVSSSGGKKTPRIKGCQHWIDFISIEETAALLFQAKLFIGVESGALHLASGVGTPSIGILGPTSAEYRLPRNSRSIAVTSDLPCLGCHHASSGPKHWQTGCPNEIRCMTEMTVEEVYSACIQLVENFGFLRHLRKNEFEPNPH